jgi:hypothetical protein
VNDVEGSGRGLYKGSNIPSSARGGSGVRTASSRRVSTLITKMALRDTRPYCSALDVKDPLLWTTLSEQEMVSTAFRDGMSCFLNHHTAGEDI